MLSNHYGMPSVVALRTRTAPITAVQGTGLPFAGALAVLAVVVDAGLPGSPSRGAPV